MPGMLGGDHAFKIGGYWRDNYQLCGDADAGQRHRRASRASGRARPTRNDCATVAVGCQMR